MTYILLVLFFTLCLIALYLDHLRRRDLVIARRAARLVDDYHRQVVEDKQIADKDEALIKRLYQRINELEARCYRLRREGDNKAKQLMKSIQLYREVMDIEDDPPFEIKKNWVEELNLRGVISGTRKEKSIELLCQLGRFILTLGTPPPTRWACKLEIRQTLELPNQRHWADI